MTIKNIEGNLLKQTGILVHGCNSAGVMGAGVAKSFKDTWPDVYRAYRQVFMRRGLRLGECIVVASAQDQFEPWASNIASQIEMWSAQLPKGVLVVNLVTQKDYGRNPKVVYVSYDAVEQGFRETVSLLAHRSGLPVYFPLIGCGLANGKWDAVSERIELAMPSDVEKTLVAFKN